MSNTALVWFACFGTLAVATLRRPAWGIALYMLTYYACPHLWWWGEPVIATLGYRTNLFATIIFAAAVFFGAQASAWGGLTRSQRMLLLLLLLYAVNATFVHVLFAADPEQSGKGLTLLWKYIGLLFLICAAVRTRSDFKILVWSIILGSLYIGYEVVFNQRGYGGRLEGVGVSGALESNYLAGFISLALPLVGYWLFFGSKWLRAASLVILVLLFEVILRCNSRGAFLGMIVGGGWMLIAARGQARRYAICAVSLALLATLFMVQDDAIRERFLSTFSSAEERDRSSQARLYYWGAAIRMIGDYPYGRGGEAAFKSNVGGQYISASGDQRMAVHQGYLDITASWGIQGAFLYLSAIMYAWLLIARTCRAASQRGDPRCAFFGVLLQTSLLTQLVVCLFISSLDGEWFFWYFALATCYARLYSPANETEICSTHQTSSRGIRESGHWPREKVGSPVHWQPGDPGTAGT